MPLRYTADPFADPKRLQRTKSKDKDNISHQLDLVNPYRDKIINEYDQLNLWYGSDLKNKQGKWKELFKNKKNDKDQKHSSKLVVEIGSHFGSVLCQMCLDYPQNIFIGFDITLKRVYKSATNIKNLNINNGCIIYCNANHIEAIFRQKEIDGGVVIFFPDPWAKKKKQLKNKLLNHEFVAKLYKLLAKDAFIWFKTDHYQSFITGCELLSEHKFRHFNKSLDQDHHWLLKNAQNYTSLFEKRFKDKNLHCYEAFYIK